MPPAPVRVSNPFKLRLDLGPDRVNGLDVHGAQPNDVSLGIDGHRPRGPRSSRLEVSAPVPSGPVATRAGVTETTVAVASGRLWIKGVRAEERAGFEGFRPQEFVRLPCHQLVPENEGGHERDGDRFVGRTAFGRIFGLVASGLEASRPALPPGRARPADRHVGLASALDSVLAHGTDGDMGQMGT